MQTNLVGRYFKEGYGDNVVYNEIVAAYVYRGNLRLVVSNPDNVLYTRTGVNAVVVERNPIPAGGVK